MRPDAVREIIQDRPFFPFRVYVSDGATYDVTHPEAGWVSGMILNVHVRPAGLTDGPGQRHARISLIHITRIEVYYPGDAPAP
jgi:hypothetical protein